MRNILLFCIIATFMPSCRSLHTSGASVVPGAINVIVPDVQGKLRIDKSQILTGYSISKTYFGIFNSADHKYLDADIPGPAGNNIKNAAVYKALENTDYDIIVNPKYVIERKRSLFFRSVSCEASGYGAYIEILDGENIISSNNKSNSTKTNNSKPASTSTNSTNNNSTYKIGDKVKFKAGLVIYTGEVTNINGSTYAIKYQSAGSTKTSNIKKSKIIQKVK